MLFSPAGGQPAGALYNYATSAENNHTVQLS